MMGAGAPAHGLRKGIGGPGHPRGVVRPRFRRSSSRAYTQMLTLKGPLLGLSEERRWKQQSAAAPVPLPLGGPQAAAPVSCVGGAVLRRRQD